MYIGQSDEYSGQLDYYIGQYYISIKSSSSYSGEGDQIWEVRDMTTNNIVESFGFREMLPSSIASRYFRVKYIGQRPIKLIGFYLEPRPGNDYTGSSTPEDDLALILNLGDRSEMAHPQWMDPLSIGLTLIQPDYETELDAYDLFKNGVGDSKGTAIPFRVKEDKILFPEEQFVMGVTMAAPSDSRREVRKALTFEFTLAAFTIDAHNILPADAIIESEVCDG